MYRDADLSELENRLEYTFADRGLLERALCHASYINEAGGADSDSNERLEFLGDAVLGLGIAAYLYEKAPKVGEGKLTAMRAGLVRSDSLADLAREIDLGRYLRLGKGAEKNGERENGSVLEDAFEAVMGAVYLDGGASESRRVVRRIFTEKLDEQLRAAYGGENYYDYKTNLQIELQRNGCAEIRYETVSESGPDHSKTFCVRVSSGGAALGEGEGKTKKHAEQHAAKMALEALGCI
ncbi:MAG: ribonuclease III [Clostridiales Family XIII bacterium]|jgi:ribonuclease-3|nr:ribonuclease III [Clostridiales Family XIII bacterium]